MKLLKKFGVVVIATAMLFGMISCKANVEHEHTFAKEWTSDNTNHWHVATCEHKDEVYGKVKHLWNKGEITTNATCEEDGKKTFTCTVCGNKSKTETVNKIEHEWNEGEITIDSTEDIEGLKTFTCIHCKKTKTEVIPKLVHTHKIARDWTSDDEKHWHKASCDREEHRSDVAEHSWVESNRIYETCEKDGTKTLICEVCGNSKTEIIPAIGHKLREGWQCNNETHYHECEYCRKKIDETPHNFKIVSDIPPTVTTNGLEEKICTVCEKVSSITTWSLESIGGYSGNWNKIKFGTWPQTIKSSKVTIDESISITQGAHTYYKGSDGWWYAKVKAEPYKTNTISPKFSDGTEIKWGNIYYFRVEPIYWQVLSLQGGGKLVLSEKILTANISYYPYSEVNRTIDGKKIYSSNYEHSRVRAYLNGLSYVSKESNNAKQTTNNDFLEKGFLQTAFTENQIALIRNTSVDNSPKSTSDADPGNGITEANFYDCNNTTDKIFLLSMLEATTEEYGFPINGLRNTPTRTIKPTDFALANYADDYSAIGNGGSWWLRSPYNGYRARIINGGGYGGEYRYTEVLYIGIVPALRIDKY